MRIVRAFLLLLCALAVVASSPGWGQKLDVSEHELANGMKLLIHEDHDLPSVAMYFFFQIGSRNERPGVTGISHFFEHMMFNGAKKYGHKEFDRVMEKNGGANNAYTSRDVTVYTDWFPKEALNLMMDMEADRIRNLQFDPKIIKSERGVVANERRLAVDNSSFGTLYEQMNAAAYTAHPYGWSVIGWASDIKAWTMDDLKHHYRIGYAPNNCTMIVAGDVATSEVLRLAKKHFEPIPRQDPPEEVRTREPKQLGEKRVTVGKPAQLPIVIVSYHVPESRHKDNLAIEVLGTILSTGRSSRLYRRLVDQDQLVRSVSQSHDMSIDPGQLLFILRPRSGATLESVEKTLFEELANVRREGVTAQELEKAKNLLLVDLYQKMKTIGGKADLLGQFEVYHGDFRKLFTAGDDLSGVTAEDVKRVANKYVGPKLRTVATLIPEKEEGK